MNHSSNQAELPKKNERFIDIDEVIGAKNPRLLKVLPRFLINYIKRVIHQEELNEAINEQSHRYRVDFADAAMEVFGTTSKIISGDENIPKTGGIIMAANHPLGGLEAMAMLQVVGKYRQDVRFLVNDILLLFKNFKEIFVPINKHGKNSEKYKKGIEEVYGSDTCLMVFPAGLVSRKRKSGTVKDLMWKKSFVVNAIEHKKDVYPVYVDAHNSNFFYNLGYWRIRLGIKANVEMFYLVDEMYKQNGNTIGLIFGEPISWKTFTEDHAVEYWSDKVEEHV